MHAITSSCILALGFVAYTQGHGGHSQQPVVSPDADWATRHMAGKYYARKGRNNLDGVD
jgi:hypothetical protein